MFLYLELLKNCLNKEFFLACIFPHLDWIRDNTDQKKLRIWTFFAFRHFCIGFPALLNEIRSQQVLLCCRETWSIFWQFFTSKIPDRTFPNVNNVRYFKIKTKKTKKKKLIIYFNYPTNSFQYILISDFLITKNLIQKYCNHSKVKFTISDTRYPWKLQQFTVFSASVWNSC